MLRRCRWLYQWQRRWKSNCCSTAYDSWIIWMVILLFLMFMMMMLMIMLFFTSCLNFFITSCRSSSSATIGAALSTTWQRDFLHHKMSFSLVWINYSVMVMLDRIIGKLVFMCDYTSSHPATLKRHVAKHSGTKPKNVSLFALHTIWGHFWNTQRKKIN